MAMKQGTLLANTTLEIAPWGRA